jgi:hypothetical protein
VRQDVPLAIPRLTVECPPAPQPSGSIVAEPRWDVYYAVVLAASLAIVEAGRTAAVTTAIERGLLPPPGRNR